MYDAVNRGLAKAQGEICAYLNCDEQYLPCTFAKVLRFFAAHPEVDVLFGDFILTDIDGRPLSYRRVVLPTLQHLRVAPLGTGTCATFFRRNLLERNLIRSRMEGIGRCRLGGAFVGSPCAHGGDP